MNELNQETSPYLLQHANNPVHWKSWNDHTLQLAQEKNKLLLISIGYSTCHWCHVMEHESFESENVAQVMNAHFINIKIDREERPDIDAVYMNAVQIMTGRGGWPLNIVCLPDGRPVWGGTYFRKNEWIDTLQQLQNLYENQPQKLYEYAQKLTNGIAGLQLTATQPKQDYTTFSIETLLEKWQKSFDWEYGGMARAPKFMMPNNYLFLMRYAFETKDKNLMNFVDLTLTKMAQGGIFDTIHGGFSRYSVDLKWHVPHFEKMLYDNGQLLSLYAQAYKYFKKDLYKEIIEKTVQFLETDFLASNGGFFSALDADSLTIDGVLEEGAFYVWTEAELKEILQDDFQIFAEIYNINDFGYWEHGNYVLIQNQSLETVANKNQLSVNELLKKREQWEANLLQKRNLRSKPRLDDKILTSWNAIAISGLIEASMALENDRYLNLALKTVKFITDHLVDANGNLYRNYKDGKCSISAFLDDYAFAIQALINCYRATCDENYLELSNKLTDRVMDLFLDEGQGFFAYKSRLDKQLIANQFEIEDNVIPSSNAIMAQNLLQLGILYENRTYEAVAKKMLEVTLSHIDYPSAYSQWLQVYLDTTSNFSEIVVSGSNISAELNQLQKQYLPNSFIVGNLKESKIPHLLGKLQQNQTSIYLCNAQMCWPAVSNLEQLNDLQKQ